MFFKSQCDELKTAINQFRNSYPSYNLTYNADIKPDQDQKPEKLEAEDNKNVIKTEDHLKPDDHLIEEKQNIISAFNRSIINDFKAEEKLEDLGMPRKIAKNSKDDRKALYHFKDQLNELERIDLYNEDYDISSTEILNLPEIIDKHISMCLIKGKYIFCYGNKYHNNYTGLAFTVNKSDMKTVIKPYGNPCYQSRTIYFKQIVYAFGGISQHGESLKSVSNFSFELDK